MSELAEPRRWSYQASARLKLVQASCRDWSSDQRRAALSQELDHLSKDLPPGRRPEYLRELANRFPAGMPLQPESAPGEDVPNSESPDKILNDFVICCANLPAAKRESFIAYLEEVGLVQKPTLPPTTPLALLEDQVDLDPTDVASIQLVLESLKLSLNLELDQPMNLYRLMRVLRWMFESFSDLEDLVWRAWGEIAPASKLRPGLPLRDAIGPYVTAGQGAEPGPCNSSIDATAWMAKSITNGLGRGGKNFCDELFRYFSPETIVKETQKRSGLFQGENARCWEEYVNLFDQMDPAYLEQWLRNRVAEVGEEWFRCEQENA
jgi:hypothetical protein